MTGQPRPGPGHRREYRFPDVTRHALSNGLRLVVAPMPRLPLVTVLALVDAGAACDGPSVEGVASLTAHALGEGTARFDGTELTEQFEALGSGFDASSGWDDALASITVTPARLEKAMTLLGEVLTAPRFSERDVLRLRAERLADLLQQQVEPRGLAEDRFEEYLYVSGSRYGVPSGGSAHTVNTLDAETVKMFHAAHYAPQATILIFVGDVMPEVAVRLAERALGGWTGAVQSTAPVDDRVRGGGPRVHIVGKADAPQTELRVGHRGLPRAHPDYFPVAVMNALLGGLFSSRINLNLRERNAYTYGANSAFDWRRRAGPFVVATAVKTDVTAAAAREILVEIDKMRAETVTADELSLATNYLDGVFPIRYETTYAVAGAIAIAEVFSLGEDYYSLYRERIRAVNAEDVRRVAEDHLHPDEMLIVAVGDASAIRQPLEALGAGPVEVHEVEQGRAAP
jgi:zinc protease